MGGLRTFAPDGGMKFGFDPQADNFFWCVGQGGMGIQTAPAASLLCASSYPRRRRRGAGPTSTPARSPPLASARARLRGGAGKFVDPIILAMAAVPLTQRHSIWCGFDAASRSCHSSAFLTGLRSDVFQRCVASRGSTS